MPFSLSLSPCIITISGWFDSGCICSVNFNRSIITDFKVLGTLERSSLTINLIVGILHNCCWSDHEVYVFCWQEEVGLPSLQGILTWGAQYLPSGITGLLNSTVPLWVAILALLIFKRRLSKRMIIGLCTGFGGLMLLVAPSLSTGELSPVGTTALIISSV